jgi:methylglyoxal synthase
MHITKNIALVAHDNRKQDLCEWVEWNYFILIQHNLFCTGTTGKMVENAILGKLRQINPDIENLSNCTRLKSGPLGGDQQLGALIAEEQINLLIFFWDPLTAQPHDTDVKALLRIAVLYNIPTACNRATADFMISSSLLNSEYQKQVSDFSGYINRFTGPDKKD